MTKLALLSDIHGNYMAMQAFLAYLSDHPVDGVICLGDYVTDGPYPERVMELLYNMRDKYHCHMIRGNREEYLLDNIGNPKGWKPSSANGALHYTLQRMTDGDMAFFASLPSEREVKIEGCPTLYICHGIPGRIRGNVKEEAGLRKQVMQELQNDYLLGGHSHHQEIYRQQGKTYINPGALGLAIDGVGGQVPFAVLTGTHEKWEAELVSIPYDVETYLKAFTESGLDELGMTLNKALKKTLVTGINYFYKCIVAMEQEAAETGIGSIARMPEEAWRRLEERFGL
jgi:putative phosphoesterase